MDRTLAVPIGPAAVNLDLPDRDVFVIDASGCYSPFVTQSISGVGTTLIQYGGQSGDRPDLRQQP